MKTLPTCIQGLLILEPRIHSDARGHFLETYSEVEFNITVGQDVRFVQDNHSRSTRGVLRGLHFQHAPHAQGRLARVVHGEVFDVAVDIRRDSPSYGRWHAVNLSGDNHRMVWMPAGLAHGFMVLSDSADFVYKVTSGHAPQAERCIRWNDPSLGIAWPMLDRPPVLSDRDAKAPWLDEALAMD